MRIVHVEAGRHLYGGAAQVRELLTGLTAAGCDSVLACPRRSALAALPSARVVELPMSGELDVLLLPRLVRLFRAREAAESFALGDPYVATGLVTTWRVREWNVVVGEGLQS